MGIKRHKTNADCLPWTECIEGKYLDYARKLSPNFGVSIEFVYRVKYGYSVLMMRTHHDGNRIYAIGEGDTALKAFLNGIEKYNARPNCERKTVNLPPIPC